MPFSAPGGTRRVFSCARGDELFRKPAGSQPDFHAPVLAGSGAADRVQRRLPSDVPSQRAWRLSAGIRADETARRGPHRGICCSASRPIASRTCRRFSRSRRSRCRSRCSACIAISATHAEMARTVWRRVVSPGASATGTTCCFSACSSVCGFCGLRARGRGPAVSRDQPRVGHCRDSDAAAPAALSRDSRIVRLRPRFRHHP